VYRSTLALLLLAILSTILAADAPRTFTNPVSSSGQDPWVTRSGSAYYYCQQREGSVWVGKTERLEDLGRCDWKRVWTPAPSGPYSKEIWAPELHHLRGRWYIYVAADDGKNENHRMIALEGSKDDPQAPFVFKSKLAATTDRWAIDGTVLEMPRDRLYFIWSGWDGTEDVAQNLYIAAMSNPTTIDGERVCISRPEHDWEQRGRPLVNEGPEILRHGDKVFLIYSASGSWGDDYCLGRLTLAGSDPMKPGSWIKTPAPVFSRTDTVFGPGHASFTTSPDGKEDWIVYHAARSKGSGWRRNVRIQRFFWSKDGSPDFGLPESPGVALPVPTGGS
jgi:GH43 family beta-xylosidase